MAPRSGLCPEMMYRLEEDAVDKYIDASFSSADQLQRLDGEGDYDMVLTAIDDSALSRQICEWCRARRIPVNVADVPPECDFYFGSQLRRGPLQVMVSTGGKGPRLARQIRQRIESALPGNIGEVLQRVGQLRCALRAVAPDQQQSPARMAWMTDVCDTWSLEQLNQLDDELVQKLLASGWARGRRVPSFAEVCSARKAPLSSLQRLRHALPRMLRPASVGFAIGIGCMLLLPRRGRY